MRSDAVVLNVDLSLRVPEGARDAVRRAMRARGATKQEIRDLYFDTADDRLAAAGFSLRVRRIDRRWSQILELEANAGETRLEHQVAMRAPARGAVPMVDLARHHDSSLAGLLRKAVGHAPDLRARFEVQLDRTSRRATRQTSVVELSLDQGHIRAGERSEPLFELSVEPVRGPFSGAAALVERWIEQHGVWFDAQSHAEKGWLLARNQRVGLPTFARPAPLHKRMSPDSALRMVVAACLAHLLPNLSALSRDASRQEHLHQARVAVRRLRTALRHMGHWSSAVQPAWEPDLATLLRDLGATRDRDAWADSVLPELRAAGAPIGDLPKSNVPDPVGLARSPATTRLLIGLLAFVHGDPVMDTAPTLERETDLRTIARPMLNRLHRQLVGDGRTFASDTDAAKHRTRRRLKRLRYCVEFMSPLFPAKQVRSYLKAIAPAQDALGAFNDAVVAQSAFRASSVQEPKAWFAVGWLAARRPALQQSADAKLVALQDAPHFWRKGGRASG
jgi:inorganic triphosphatase YgiF